MPAVSVVSAVPPRSALSIVSPRASSQIVFDAAASLASIQISPSKPGLSGSMRRRARTCVGVSASPRRKVGAGGSSASGAVSGTIAGAASGGGAGGCW